MVDIFFCGDYLNSFDRSDFLSFDLKQVIRDHDYACCNFEAPIVNPNIAPVFKIGANLSQTKKSLEIARNIGFNLFSFANNHIMDFGVDGLKKTIDEIDKFENLHYFGAGLNFQQVYKPLVIEKENIKIAFIATGEKQQGCFSEYADTGGYAWINHPLVDQWVMDLRRKVDFIFFIAHAGVEGINLPLPEWRRRYMHLCDLGVDFIIGHHPHVPQGFEKYNKSLIFYSLGNFFFEQKTFVKNQVDSYSVSIKLLDKKNFEFKLVPYQVSNSILYEIPTIDFNQTIHYLNKLLIDDYEYNINQLAIKLYHERYLKFYQKALGSIRNNKYGENYFARLFKELFMGGDYRRKMDYLLLHLIQIESHRYTVQRALSQLLK